MSTAPALERERVNCERMATRCEERMRALEDNSSSLTPSAREEQRELLRVLLCDCKALFDRIVNKPLAAASSSSTLRKSGSAIEDVTAGLKADPWVQRMQNKFHFFRKYLQTESQVAGDHVMSTVPLQPEERRLLEKMTSGIREDKRKALVGEQQHRRDEELHDRRLIRAISRTKEELSASREVQQQREMQERMSVEIRGMVSTLKANALEIQRVLDSESDTLAQTERAVQDNTEVTKRQRQRLVEQTSATRRFTCTSCFLMMLVTFAFFFTFYIIRLFPPARGRPY